ncbi:MAG: hypothetical protein JSV82_03460 [Planctomycetota bacterium]|nr:MAG: hypothetical protein JSV82_03460 [Planctomycetota bacterium]
MLRCPGQDQRFWKSEDIFEVNCPNCNQTIEFFKDEPKLKCKKCGQLVVNPKIDLGCAQWCQYAQQCVGILKSQDNDKSSKKQNHKTKKKAAKEVQSHGD